MRIWHQSFTVLDDVPHYRDALARHLRSVAAPGTEVHLHGMAAGTYPSDYPGTHIKYAYLSGLHKEQFVHAALRAQDEGYDAFLIATIPDTAYEECRSLVDIPVVAFGHTSVLMAATLGSTVGIVNFIGALEPQLRRNMRAYQLDRIVGPIRQVEAEFTDVMGAYAAPERAARGVPLRGPAGDRRGRDSDRAGGGAAQRLPRRPRGGPRRRRPRARLPRHVPAGRGDARAPAPRREPRRVAPRVPPRAATARAGRPRARILRNGRRAGRACGPGGTRMKEDIEVDVAVAGAGACGLMAALRAAQNPDVIVAVFEKSTAEGCNAAVSSGSLAAGGTRFQAAAGIDDSPERHAADILANSGDERHRGLVSALCAVAPDYVHWLADDLGYPLEVGVDMPRKGMSMPRLHADPDRRGGGPLIAHLRARLIERPNVALLDRAPVTGLRVEGGRVVGLHARQGGNDLDSCRPHHRPGHRRVRRQPRADGAVTAPNSGEPSTAA